MTNGTAAGTYEVTGIAWAASSIGLDPLFLTSLTPGTPPPSGDDIVFRSINGQAAIREMNGTAIAGGGAVSPNAGPSRNPIGLT